MDDPDNMEVQKTADTFPSPDSFAHILTTPFCWQSTKVCQFLRASHNLIKESQDEEILAFNEKVDKKETSYLWLPELNWETVLGPSHFSILQNVKGKPVRNLCNTSVLCLLRIIRNKYEHWNEFKDHEKTALNWFTYQNGKWELDEHLFATYWITKFPKLLVYLWKQFEKFKSNSTLREFYPLEQNIGPTFRVVDFVHYLIKAAAMNLDEGWMENRYHFEKEQAKLILELRSLPEFVLQEVLGKCTVVKIQIDAHGISFIWYEKSQGQKYLSYKNIKGEERIKSKLWDGNRTESYIFVNQLYQIGTEKILSDIVQEMVNSHHVLLFRNGSIPHSPEQESILIKSLCTHLNIVATEKPVSWADVSETRKSKVLNEFQIKFQNSSIFIKEISVDNSETQAKLLSRLEGKNLNILLKSKQLEIFTQYQLDEAPKNYLERKLYDRTKLSCKILKEKIGDVFVVFDLSIENYKNHVDANTKTVVVLENLKTISKNCINNDQTFLFSFNISDKDQIYSKFEAVSKQSNVHCFRYLTNGTLEWIKTLGSFSNAEAAFAKASKEIGLISEDDLVKRLQEHNKQTVFLADKPGMGKSFVIESLSRKLSRQICNSFVICTSINDFLNALRKEFHDKTISKSNIEKTLCKLCISNTFEMELFQYWLQQPNNAKIRFEILFDGLDEVTHDQRDLAFEVLQVLQTHFSCVRVWTTVRDHMLDDICAKFGCLGYKLEPFSFEDQVNFLEHHWLDYWLIHNANKEPPSSETLRNYAGLCVKVPLSDSDNKIAGIPLQCRMIAEINEPKVIKEDFTINKNCSYALLNLYDQMVERKFEVYMKEKKRLTVSMNDYIAKTIRSEAERMHIYFAVKLVHSETLANQFQNALIKAPNLDSEVIGSVLDQGLVQRLTPLMFIHRTFAEYIIASFVYTGLKGNFVGIDPSNPDFQNFVWNEVFATILNSKSKSTPFKNPVICHFLDQMCKHDEYHVCLRIRNLFADADVIFKECSTGDDLKEISRRFIFCRHASSLLSAAIEMNYKNLIALYLQYEKPLISIVTALLISLSLAHYTNHESFPFDFLKYVFKMREFFEFGNWQSFQSHKNKFGYEPLHWIIHGINMYHGLDALYVVHDNVLEFIGYLVSKDKSLLELKDSNGQTPLLIIARLGWVLRHYFTIFSSAIYNLFEYFITNLGANVNAVDNEGCTALHYLLPVLYYKIIMENGCSVINHRNNDGNTPLLETLKTENHYGLKTICTLSQHKSYGADFNVKDNEGNTVLHVAIERYFNSAFVTELIKCGANVCATNERGKLPLHSAVENDTLAVAKVLINENPSCLEVRDKSGRLPLDYASSIRMYKYLVYKTGSIGHWCIFSNTHTINKINIDKAQFKYSKMNNAECLSPIVSMTRTEPLYSREINLSDSEQQSPDNFYQNSYKSERFLSDDFYKHYCNYEWDSQSSSD